MLTDWSIIKSIISHYRSYFVFLYWSITRYNTLYSSIKNIFLVIPLQRISRDPDNQLISWASFLFCIHNLSTLICKMRLMFDMAISAGGCAIADTKITSLHNLQINCSTWLGLYASSFLLDNVWLFQRTLSCTNFYIMCLQALILSGHDHDQCTVTHATKYGPVEEVSIFFLDSMALSYPY